ncbi:helix-turn-helix domain-containing protein [Streptomyces sp. NPDC127049]|uniref:helix-turn-helix domain-containing protein n=1 Tax=Streptomyces sp. NPDC127049 TaxID=3347118 RepID=UPI003647C9D9
MKGLSKFGPELRRRRLAAGMTLDGLAARVHYSKGQLSKVETGVQRPTTELARLCDAALGAEGALAALVPAAAAPTLLDRRRVMAAGAASALALGAPSAVASPGTKAVERAAEGAGGPLVDGVRALFDQFRALGQTAPSAAVLPALEAQTRALPALAEGSGARSAKELYLLASRFAEYTGWMAQESGDEHAALTWTDHAVRLAAAGGDHHLEAYALVRRGLLTFYAGDARSTIAVVQGAQAGRLPARIRGLAAQREAQGHALNGDRDACLRALDRARALLERAATDGSAGALPVIGTTHLSDPTAMTTGWCLLDLGLPRAAAEVLDREVGRIPTHATRTRVRYGVRRVLAHAVGGEVDHACALAVPLLRESEALASGTIRTDLRRLSRVLGRHPRNPSARALAPRLAAALQDTVPTAPAREAVPRG